MTGILSYGAYLPVWRLNRLEIAQALRVAPGKGHRAVASHDEDSTSLAVEACRAAVRGAPVQPDDVVFVTTSPAYLDKTNATAVHAALGLDSSIPATDALGAVRSWSGALRAALRGGSSTLIAAGDVRTGLPGSGDERDGGDAGSALLVGDGPALAHLVSVGSATGEFLDRWRAPGEGHPRVWEERFGEQAYAPLVEAAWNDALKAAGATPGDISLLAVAGTHSRAVLRFAAVSGVDPAALVDGLAKTVGSTGAAHPGLVLGAALDVAQPGQLLALAVLADGADVFVFRVADDIEALRGAARVTPLLAAPTREVSYPTMLTWRGVLRREPPRRPEPERPAPPASARSQQWKFGLTGSECSCGVRQLPPQRVCAECGAVDETTPFTFADVPAKVSTFTVDHLSYSLSPPVVVAVVDFEGGGRLQCELTDVDPTAVQVGQPVDMTFRRLYSTGDGVANYFWKARPSREGQS